MTAEIVKIEMLKLDKSIKENISNVQILFQIHDELLITIPKEQIGLLGSAARPSLELVVDWDALLVATMGAGASWAEVSK